MTTWPVACLKPVRKRGALALVHLVEHDRQVGLTLGQFAQDLPRAVLGIVIDHDDLLADRHRAHSAEDLVDRFLFVVNRDDHRENKVVGNAVNAQLACERLAQGRDQPFRAFVITGELGNFGWLARGAVWVGQSRLVGKLKRLG